MNILAFDTTMAACSVAVVTDDKQVQHSTPMAKGHAERLMPMIKAAMAEAGLDFAGLDRLAVTLGPGSFTGVRVGIAAARGLSLAADVPLVGVNSLQALAWSASSAGLELSQEAVAIALDARRGQVYFQLFATRCPDMAPPGPSPLDPCPLDPCPLGPPQLLAPRAAALALPAQTITLLGSGAELVATAADHADRLVTAMTAATPDMTALAMRAAHLPPSPAPVRPLYLRPPDAKPQTDPTPAPRG